MHKSILISILNIDGLGLDQIYTHRRLSGNRQTDNKQDKYSNLLRMCAKGYYSDVNAHIIFNSYRA